MADPSDQQLPAKAEEISPLDQLNKEERQFLMAWMECGSQVDAWAKHHRAATRASAYVSASRMMSRIRNKIGARAIFDLAGVGEADIAKACRDAMNAEYTKHIVVPRKGGGADVVPCPPIPDHHARLRAAELMSKNLGLQGKKDELAGPGGGVIVQIVNYAGSEPDGSPRHVTVQIPSS